SLPPAALSFPTRRSSDLNSTPLFSTSPIFCRIVEKPLTRVIGTLSNRSLVRLKYTSAVSCIRSSKNQISNPTSRDSVVSQLRFRSEEHTSELQSRENLVC